MMDFVYGRGKHIVEQDVCQAQCPVMAYNLFVDVLTKGMSLVQNTSNKRKC